MFVEFLLNKCRESCVLSRIQNLILVFNMYNGKFKPILNLKSEWWAFYCLIVPRPFFGKSPKSGQLILLSIEETPILEPLTTCFCKQISVWKYIVYSNWTNWDIEMQNKKMSILRLQNRMVCNWSIPTRQYENQTRPRLQTKKK